VIAHLRGRGAVVDVLLAPELPRLLQSTHQPQHRHPKQQIRLP
jgi:hypothetical protein